MKFSKRGAALVATGVAGAMVLSACGGGSSDSGSSGGGSGRVIVGESADFPENLFPLISAGNVTSVANIEAQLFPSAFDVKPDFSVEYNQDLLTEEPTLDVTDGVQTNVYTINPDAVWSDGEPITAEDFIFSWQLQRSSDPADGGCAALLNTTGYSSIASVEGSGDDDKTVTVTYTTPYADWQGLWSGSSNPVFPSHVLKAASPEAQCEATTAGWPIADGIPQDISGGPWQIKKDNIDVGSQIVTLTPNENWYGEPTGLAQLVIQNIGSDPTTAVQGIQNQEVGVIYPQPQLDLVGQVADLAPEVDSSISFGLSFEHLDFNTTDPLLADPVVRQAFGMALDRQEIVDQTVGQFSSDAQVLDNRIYVNNQPQYVDNAPDEYKTQNTAQAKSLLEGAGYVLGSDGIYAKDGQRLSFQIDTTANNPLRETTVNVMIPQLKEAGIEATFNANPDIFAGPEKPTSLIAGGFQIALFAWVASPFITSNESIYQQVTGDNVGQNYSRLGTPEIDALFDELVAQPDPDQAADLANQIDVLLWDQMATIPLYQKPTFLAWNSSTENVEDNASQSGPLWNSSTWTTSQ
ncbi:peptide/nickel transport system substrate-binding protein [Klenkia soli]|uniref:Peptide/nickel transport system substrate-binding protein n=1 Tax=Klenkia soli TaxID=1052260 RepID=A0A1H0CCF8_9ACTN|nr:ABC transporter family substrate-binding protein [Klenkia soli]SDN55567.1 peptide/nickel transport system substrate-binding protein [Klenkia soli]